MNTNDIRFLPIDFVNKELTIQEPYLESILKYLDKKNIQYKYIEAKAIIPTIDMEDDILSSIIKMIKNQRNDNLQKRLSKNYL